MPKGHPYRVLIVEDQDEFLLSPADSFAADRAHGSTEEPYLELAGIARNYDDAIQFLKLSQELPDAIVIDDFLTEGSTLQSRSIEIMTWLLERCERDQIPVEARPRAVLWTSSDDASLAYTFCVAGGMQFRDKKRDPAGAKVPVDAVWAALAGHRWCPEPYPTGLASAARRAAIPWLEAGLPHAAILGLPELKKEGVTEDTMRGALEEIRKMPHTPEPPSPSYPDNWAMAIRAAKRNGWVWVPLDRHDQIPANAPLPLVIDPELHYRGLPPYGPLPVRVKHPAWNSGLGLTASLPAEVHSQSSRRRTDGRHEADPEDDRVEPEPSVAGNPRRSFTIDIFVGAATVLLSTVAYLLGSPKLAVVALVVGGISFGIVLAAQPSG